jgi:hypothetical protein
VHALWRLPSQRPVFRQLGIVGASLLATATMAARADWANFAGGTARARTGTGTGAKRASEGSLRMAADPLGP